MMSELDLPRYICSGVPISMFCRQLGRGVQREILVIANMTGYPALTPRTGFVEVTQVRSDWAPDPAHPRPTLARPHRVPYGVTLIGRLFDEGTLGRVGRALEAKAAVGAARPPGF